MPNRPAAIEIPEHRCESPIGTAQRHYTLSRPLGHNGYVYSHVIIIDGRDDFDYIYAADADGEVIDWAGIADVPHGGGDEAALAYIGFQIAPAAA